MSTAGTAPAASRDLTGRLVVVTGGTDGIGAAAVRLLRARGADVVLIGRSREKADRLLAEDAARGAPGSLSALVSDLGLMRNVVDAVAQVHGRTDRIDLLLHAVGVLLTRPEHTSEGLEKDFATSYLARFLFLERAAHRGLLHGGTRMVNIAASAPRVPRIARMEFGSAAEVQARSGIRAHGQAQLANDLLTAAAPGRYGITSVGYGPGAVDTSIRREVPAFARTVLRPLYARVTRRPEQAAGDVVAALTDPDLDTRTATFRNRHGAFEPAGFVTDARRQRDLLAVSEALVLKALAQDDRPPRP